MADKIVAIFAEGPTEVEFYSAVINCAHELMGQPFTCKFKWFDMKGIGRYKNTAVRKFARLKQKNPGKEIYVFICIDSDVFEFSRKPPFDKKEVATALENAGAKKVSYIIAKQSIEDWFLTDFAGVKKFLHLPENTKIPRGNGQDALKALFKSVNKVYVKGSKVEGFVSCLDVKKIINTYCESLKPLCNTIGLDCKKICKAKNEKKSKVNL